MPTILPALLGSIVTIGIFVLSLFLKLYRMDGDHTARLVQLEIWRSNVRNDMHEISDRMEENSNQITKITTMLEINITQLNKLTLLLERRKNER